MKQFLLLFLIAFVGGVYAQNPQNQALLESQQKRFQAMMQADFTQLNVLLDDGLSYTHSNGLVETKATFMESIRSQKIVYQQLTLDTAQMKVQMYPHTAVITGVLNVNVLFQGKPVSLSLRYTSTYIKRQKIWRLIAWQSLSLPK